MIGREEVRAGGRGEENVNSILNTCFFYLLLLVRGFLC